MNLLKKLETKHIKTEKIAEIILQNSKFLPQIFDGLESKHASIKYGCSKTLLIISEKKPEIVYPNVDLFINLLESENNIFKWTATKIIGNLAAVDTENKMSDKLIGRLADMLNAGKMITANNAIYALGKIAKAKPKFQEIITDELLKVENYKYDTTECNNIAVGFVVESFRTYTNKIKNDPEVKAFLEKHSKNTRASTQKKALQLLENLKG
ncbi:MAG: hypothetical protein PHS44_03405 [Candidatus Dojkabacteria bacterium]|nr:hypothetical protein [Candidatus Dojkabacteria bacterium]